MTKSDLAEADCILLIHLLHHLSSCEEQEKLVKVCFEKLKKGGKLIVSEIGRRPWWKYIITIYYYLFRDNLANFPDL